ncbi:MAG: hypothetical protein IPG78_03470 [Ignavibacteria bacterium]|nr:hypothetical protein [Ignavibacteria bacterium]
MTDINSILENLNNDFFPITLKTCSLIDHFNDFLQVTNNHMVSKQPIHVIAPTHYQLKHLKIWNIEPFESIPYWTRYDNGFKEVLKKQVALSIKLKARFSKTINDYFNKETKRNGRFIIKISFCKNGSEKCNVISTDFVGDSILIKFEVPKKLLTTFNSILNPSTKSEISKFDLSVIDEKYLESIMDLKNNVRKIIKDQKIQFNYIANNKKPLSKTLVKKLLGPILIHSIYIKENTELYYSFSNIAISSDGRSDKGIGGLFLLIDEDILKNSDTDAFKNLISLSDKLAVRLVLQHHNEEILRHATRSAISQVFARNMSHNINSHVSYRATNLRIKDRITKELYDEID